MREPVVGSVQRSVPDALQGMIRSMRLTISLEDPLAEEVRRQAAARGLSVRAFIARTLEATLKRPAPTHVRPFRLITVGGQGQRPGVDLDRPRELETRDDEARSG